MTITAEADLRIRAFSRVLAVFAAVFALIAVATAIVPAVERAALHDTRSPWLAETVADAEREAGGWVWSAQGSARVTLPEELRNRPIQVRLVELVSDVQVSLGDTRTPEGTPWYLGRLWDEEPMVLAAYEHSELWIATPNDWRVEITAIDPPELVSSRSGLSSTVLVYRGAATSGTVSWGPGSAIFVIARTVTGYESLALPTGGDPKDAPAGSVRFEWTASPFVIIEVVAFDEEWSIELDPVPADEVTAPGADPSAGSSVDGEEGAS